MSAFSWPQLFNRDNKHCQLTKSVDKEISQAIHLLIKSCYGELLGDPNFGGNFDGLLFERLTDAFLINAKDQLLGAIRTYIPNIAVQEDDIQMYRDDDPNTVNVYVRYKIKNTDFGNEIIEVINYNTDSEVNT